MIHKNGFSLLEMLVVIGILSIVTLILAQIFNSNLRGTSQAQVLASIKQNGQSALENMDKLIRNAAGLVCPLTGSSNTLIVQNRDGTFTRYKFIDPTNNTNGYIQQDFLATASSTCATIPPDGQVLTDQDAKTGTSISSGQFSVNKSGSSASVSMEFLANPGVSFQAAYPGQIDGVKFQTSITMRLYNL